MSTTSNDTSDPYVAGVQSLDRTILTLAVLVVTAAFMLDVEENGVRLAVWPGLMLPESCLSRTLVGIDCPGCGLTRSFVHLAEGNLSESLTSNRVGWLFAFATVVQVPIRFWALRRGRPALSNGVQAALAATLIALLVANWLWNMIG